MINTFDNWLGQLFSNFVNNAGSFFTPLFKFITTLGNYGLVFLITSVVLLFFKRTRRVGVICLISLGLGTLMTNVILKHAVARQRPFYDQTSIFYTWWKNAGSLPESGYSFPSGHSTAASAFGFALFYTCNKKWSWSFLFIPIVIGITRIYFVVHYGSDVIGGLVIGALCALLGVFIYSLLVKNQKISKYIS